MIRENQYDTDKLKEYCRAVSEMNEYFQSQKESENDFVGTQIGVLKNSYEIAILSFSDSANEDIDRYIKAGNLRNVSFFKNKKMSRLKRKILQNPVIAKFSMDNGLLNKNTINCVDLTDEFDVDAMLVDLSFGDRPIERFEVEILEPEIEFEEEIEFEDNIEIDEECAVVARLNDECSPLVLSLLDTINEKIQISDLYRTDWSIREELVGELEDFIELSQEEQDLKPRRVLIRMSDDWLKGLIKYLRFDEYEDLSSRLKRLINNKAIFAVYSKCNKIYRIEVIDKDENVLDTKLTNADKHKIVRDYNLRNGKKLYAKNYESEIQVHFLLRKDWNFFYATGSKTCSKTPEYVYIRPDRNMLCNLQDQVGTHKEEDLLKHLDFYIKEKRIFLIRSKNGEIKDITVLDREGKQYETTLKHKDLELLIRYFNDVENKGLFLRDLDVPKTLTRSMISGVRIVGKDSLELKSFEEDTEILALFTKYGLTNYGDINLKEVLLKDFTAQFKTFAGFMGEDLLNDKLITANPNYKIINKIINDTLFVHNIFLDDLFSNYKQMFEFRTGLTVKLTRMVNEYYSNSLKYDFAEYFNRQDEMKRQKK